MISEKELQELQVIKEHEEIAGIASLPEEHKASENVELLRQIEQIEILVNDCKFDEAFKICQNIRNDPSINFDNISKKHKHIIVDVEEVMKHLNEVCNLLDDEEGWTVENSNPQITTKSKKYPGSNSFTLKFEGDLNFPIYNMCSLVYEIEFFPEFIPFCSESYCIKHINRGTKLCYFLLDIPFWSNREGFIRGQGVDRIDINQTIYIISRNIDEDPAQLERLGFELPPLNKNMRLKMDHFCFEIKPKAVDKFHLRALLNVEPKVSFVPQFVLNFFARKVGVHIFSKICEIAEKMDTKKMAELKAKPDSKDYYEWLEKRIENVLKTNFLSKVGNE